MWFCWLTFSILCLYQGQRDNVMCTMFDVSTFPRWNEWASNSASFHVIPPEQTRCVILSMNLTLNVFNINYQICVKGDKTRTHKSRSVVKFKFPACDDGLKELKITKKHWSWTCHLVQHLLSALSFLFHIPLANTAARLCKDFRPLTVAMCRCLKGILSKFRFERLWWFHVYLISFF